jgi:hypothetical protein
VLGARVERIADAVAEHVERQDGDRDRDTGCKRDGRPRIEQALAVEDDRPQLAFGGCTPIDRNERADSVSMSIAIISGKKTITVVITFGRISLRIRRQSEAPWAIAASMYSFSRTDSTWPRIGLATYGM